MAPLRGESAELLLRNTKAPEAPRDRGGGGEDVEGIQQELLHLLEVRRSEEVEEFG